MFREMRRKKQILSIEKIIEILNRRTSGVLATSGDDNYPYAVPLSYAYCNNKIIFHCAKTGHKIDAINRNERVSFCVIDKDTIVPEEYTTYFKSVIAFGRARILKDENEKRKSLEILARKYSPNYREGYLKEIEDTLLNVCVVEIEIEHLSGKEAIELVNS
ncbi:hypothetical protein SAMN02745245_01584 [Anaerosphaera aminiphila DSM 21120]|uniref:Nitroimidazol reductase NimA, pyridoxamine 5'-phosphate oxidase superfamily n=1 Tax=Anaerosphaera aminiphila DSM 21120 TaxID=1120995 RepID=A0A1M5TV91_9FIRM|nr:pyridoxamine 5'-phosphate oxidase family protein [Anaerosphaera aminiphila]SHH54697.1 hypothetical protein SAMN02745245_01584 [Anaerosphaera aminiphila DSM 21120]